MGMPTEEELKEALAEAARMREHGEDPQHIAKALLNLNYQNTQLKQLLKAVEMYIHSGHAVAEHQRLQKAIENARNAINRSGAIEEEHFGLR